VLLSSIATCPFAQGPQLTEPAFGANVPTRHGSQLDRIPGDAAKVPAGHPTHTRLTTSQTIPASQFVAEHVTATVAAVALAAPASSVTVKENSNLDGGFDLSE